MYRLLTGHFIQRKATLKRTGYRTWVEDFFCLIIIGVNFGSSDSEDKHVQAYYRTMVF